MMLLPLFIIGCRYDLVDEPSLDYNEHKTAADYSDFILPPSKITASHGESKSVTISWEAVENAVQYQIFAAENPFSTFSKVSETKGTETEILIEEESGITKYYCVSAVNYYGTVSSKSIVVCGSTLAVPIITAIEPSEEGNAVKLSWWMDNCSGETYENSVSYNINVYNVTNQTIKFKSLEAEGNLREVNIDGLASTTEYLFEVEVVKADSTAKECSEKTSAETAHRVIPDAPKNFNVSQGETTDSIILSWELPEKVWYRDNSGVSGFSLHALNFEIYRKLATQSDSDYGASVYTYTFNSADDYIPGDTVSWEDKDAVHGKKYTYYLKSVTNDTPGKTITAESSKTEAVDGWLVSVPAFSIASEYTKSEDQLAFEKIAFCFNVSFETFGKSYKYIIKREKYDFSDVTTPVKIEDISFTDLTELNAHKDVFENPSVDAGYYKYTLYVCPADSADGSSAYYAIDASGKYLVSADANAVPVVEGFTLADGYSDKFVLSFRYNSSYNYTIHWRNVIDGIAQAEESLELPESLFENVIEGEIFNYNHKEGVTSGDRRIYSLEASMGLSERFRPNDDTTDKIYETLGTAEPVITEYAYDKLLVEWPAVQKATAGYKISAKYEGESEELVIEAAEGVDTNYEIKTTGSDDDLKYTCVITKPAGYDDASISGKNIKFTVTSQNTVDATESTIDVCTVGPALTNVTVLPNQANIIDVKWMPVNGADGYIIRRITYKTATQHPELISEDNLSNPDVYYYDAVNNTLTINSEAADGIRASVNLVQGSYKLTDTYKEAATNTNPYEVNQSYIAWGIPYGYTVIPVKHNGSSDDFNLAGRNVSFDGNSYQNVAEKFGATIGYGLNVHAKKSESADTQVLEWDAPYNPVSSFSIYYRVAGSELNSWQVFEKNVSSTEVFNGKMTASFKPDNVTAAYEYLVAYRQETPIIDGNVPESLIKDSEIGLSSVDTNYDYTRIIDGEKIKAEKFNKGYLLAQKFTPNEAPEDVNDFSETITLTAWNYDQRSIGPDKAYLRIKNYNISNDWIQVAEVDEKLHFVKSSGAENTKVKKGSNDTTVIIEPANLIGDTKDNPFTKDYPITKGPLQVLRDVKHYYSIELVRGDFSTVIGDDDSKYAYRNITDYEFAKMVMLIFADGMIQIGELKFDNYANDPKEMSDAGLGGKIQAYHEGKTGTKYFYKFINYAPKLEMPSGKNAASLQINANGECFRESAIAGSYPLSLSEVTINVSKTNDEMPSSYQRQIKFYLNIEYEYNWLKVRNEFKSLEGTLKLQNTNIAFNTKEDCRVYVPFRLWYEDAVYYQDPTYGWWTE